MLLWRFRTIVLSLVLTGPAAVAKLPTNLDFDALRGLAVQHDGRWPPLDTLARDVVESVTGDARFGGHDPVLWLLAWTFDPNEWRNHPVIPISSAALRAELQLPATKSVFSYAELTRHAPLRALLEELSQVESGKKLDPLQSKVSDISTKLRLLERVFTGQVIRVIPDAKDVLGAWLPIAAAKADDTAFADVRAAWSALRDAFRNDDRAAFTTAVGQLRTALQALPAARRPAVRLIDVELDYNRLRPYRTAWFVMLGGALVSAVALVVKRRWFDALAVVVMLAGFGVLSYGLWLRWQIAGRIPATNMFESLLLLSWGMGVFAILAMLVQRQRVVPLTASGMGAVALILADCLPLDHFVRPTPPVLLDTIWMSIHVPIIMVSYSVLALGVLVAHVQLIAMAAAPARRELSAAIDEMHYWYIHVGAMLLLVGIITGSMWAASSWGRYWGWDPKEVWSLVAFLGYMAILHVRVDHERHPRWIYAVAALFAIAMFAVVLPTLAPITPVKILALVGTAAAMVIFVLARGQFATALKSILAFWLILMTYLGVNFVLGMGLHSYGFGTGAVVRYMFLSAVIDLALIALCTVIYLLRRPRGVTSAGVMPAVA